MYLYIYIYIHIERYITCYRVNNYKTFHAIYNTTSKIFIELLRH